MKRLILTAAFVLFPSLSSSSPKPPLECLTQEEFLQKAHAGKIKPCDYVCVEVTPAIMTGNESLLISSDSKVLDHLRRIGIQLPASQKQYEIDENPAWRMKRAYGYVVYEPETAKAWALSTPYVIDVSPQKKDQCTLFC